ncbi:MAG: hypothetical protein EAZ27_03880, partial [Cytophagales bacterium]
MIIIVILGMIKSVLYLKKNNKIFMKNIFTLLLTSYFSFAQLSNEINPNLLTKNWKASWISHPQASEKDYEALHFRKTFELKEKPTSFIVHVTADNRY